MRALVLIVALVLLPGVASAQLTGAELIRQIQMELLGRGFDPGPADGVMGAATAEAIRAYEDAKGLAVTGRATPLLLEILLAEKQDGAGSGDAPVVIESPPPQEQGLSVTAFPFEGRWFNSEQKLTVDIVRAPLGGYVIKQADNNDKFAFPGETIGEFGPIPNDQGEYIGRHTYGGGKHGATTWTAVGTLLIQVVESNVIFLKHTDSLYNKGWIYRRMGWR